MAVSSEAFSSFLLYPMPIVVFSEKAQKLSIRVALISNFLRIMLSVCARLTKYCLSDDALFIFNTFLSPIASIEFANITDEIYFKLLILNEQSCTRRIAENFTCGFDRER